jgi:hypothetical protein
MGRRKREPAVAAVAAPSPLLQHAYWAVPFALFLVTRLFCSDTYYRLSEDQLTYLVLGRTFPKHQLFNHELYLIHPPLFGYLIGLFHLLLPLLAAGLAVTVLFACLNFFAVRALARLEDLPRAAMFVGLMYIALSRPGIAYDYHVARVSVLVCGTALALLAFLRLLRDPSGENLGWAIAANVFFLLISDQSLLLLPCEAALLLARRARIGWKRWAPLAAVSMAAGLMWPAVRYYEFTHRPDVPAGIDGMVEFTRNFPLRALLQPNFLPFTDAHRSLFTQTSLSLSNLKADLLVKLPIDLVMVPTSLTAAIVLILMGAALWDARRRWRSLQWLGLSLVFLLPVGMGMNEWYSMAYIVPFSLLLMEGAAVGFTRFKLPEIAVAAALSACCFFAALAWLSAAPPAQSVLILPHGGTHFLFTRPPLVRAASLAPFFEKMPNDTGVMANQGLTEEIAYLTGKRVIAAPFDPALLDRFIDEYRISWIVLSSENLELFHSQREDFYTNRLMTHYVQDHPERYRPATCQREDAPAFYPNWEYCVFEVLPPAPKP